MPVRSSSSPKQAPIRVIRRERSLDDPYFRSQSPADRTLRY